MNEIRKVSGTQCETVYSVNSINVRLWAIIGGTLALGLNDYRYSERFNYSEKHDSKKHNYLTWEPPTYNDLRGGVKTLTDFTNRASKIINKRKERVSIIREILGNKSVVFATVRNNDKERVTMSWCASEAYCAPVTGSITAYRCRNPHSFGRLDSEISEVASPQWLKLQTIANLNFTKNRNWDEMTNAQFDLLLDCLRDVVR